MNTKPIALILIIILVVNILLFAFKIIGTFSFWMVIVVIAAIAYKGMPILRQM